MNCNSYEDKIISFIENELSDKERAEFQLELDNNSDLRAQYNEMRKILISLHEMPKVEPSSDFIIKLNAKIDDYEFKSTNIISSLLNKIINYDYLPQLTVGVVSLVCLFVVTYFWSSNNNNSSQIMLSNSSSVNDSLNHQVANLDSLDNDKNIDK